MQGKAVPTVEKGGQLIYEASSKGAKYTQLGTAAQCEEWGMSFTAGKLRG